MKLQEAINFTKKMEPITRKARKIDPQTGLDKPIEIIVDKIKIEKGAKTETGRYWTVTLGQTISDGHRWQQRTIEYPDEHRFEECIIGHNLDTNEPIVDNAILAQKLAPFNILLD